MAQECDELARVARRKSVAELGIGERALELLERLSDTTNSTAPASHDETSLAGAPSRDSRHAIRTFGSRTARTQLRRARVACCASTASDTASASSSPSRCQRRSSRSSPSSRRSASSITSLSPIPDRAARTFTARSTSSSIVSVVRPFGIAASMTRAGIAHAWHTGELLRDASDVAVDTVARARLQVPLKASRMPQAPRTCSSTWRSVRVAPARRRSYWMAAMKRRSARSSSRSLSELAQPFTSGSAAMARARWAIASSLLPASA